MKLVSKENKKYILRLDPGEEFRAALEDFCTENNIRNAWVEGIGSVGRLNIAYYDLKKREYEENKFDERMEIINISGNIAIKEGEVFCHAHGIFGKRDMSTVAGHIMECVISATAEVYLQELEGESKRTFDDETGLHLLNS